MTNELSTITPAEAARLIDGGARLVDIRESNEHARERIPAALSRPLAGLDRVEGSGPVIFHCRTGHRTAANAARLRRACDGEAYLLSGGIEAWKAQGMAVLADPRQPIEIMRQVQLAGGGVILLSMLLTFLAGPLWSLLAAAVGAGMVHAGLTGSCAMTRLLAPMPWNRPGPA
jgi:rhodanese-related sulfurtransferase